MRENHVDKKGVRFTRVHESNCPEGLHLAGPRVQYELGNKRVREWCICILNREVLAKQAIAWQLRFSPSLTDIRCGGCQSYDRCPVAFKHLELVH
jgi:hypothetical protein